MSTPKYVTRFARVARAIPLLAQHPTGMRLEDLARQLDSSEEDLRAEIKAFYVADPPQDLVGGYWEPIIEFVADPGADATEEEYPDVDTAAYVRLHDLRFGAHVGVRFMSVSQLALAARSGYRLLAREPDNTVLDEALDALGRTVLDGYDQGGPRWLGETARTIREAIRAGRRVKITYARAWKPGLVERVVEPYYVVHTRRGWEMDARVVRDGDSDAQIRVRTFLVSGTRDIEVLDETFERPDDAEDLVTANREQRAVEVVVPHDGRWAVELYAESAEVLSEDEQTVRLRAQLLPPVERRLGLLLLTAGLDAAVEIPDEYADAGRVIARELLDHHRDEP